MCRSLARLLRRRVLLSLLTLLWPLGIGIRATGSLGVAGGSAVVGDLGAMSWLIPALLRLLRALLTGALLRSSLSPAVVDGDTRVLIQGRLVDSALIIGHLRRQSGRLELAAIHSAGPARATRWACGIRSHSCHSREAATRRGVVVHYLRNTCDHSHCSYQSQRPAQC